VTTSNRRLRFVGDGKVRFTYRNYAARERWPRCGAALVVVSRTPFQARQFSQKPIGPGPPVLGMSN
jgi:hypothetical protein